MMKREYMIVARASYPAHHQVLYRIERIVQFQVKDGISNPIMDRVGFVRAHIHGQIGEYREATDFIWIKAQES